LKPGHQSLSLCHFSNSIQSHITKVIIAQIKHTRSVHLRRDTRASSAHTLFTVITWSE